MNLYWILLGVFLGLGILCYIIIPKKYRYIVLCLLSVIMNFIYNHFLGIFILITSFSVWLNGIIVLKLDKKHLPLIKKLSLAKKRIAKKKLQNKKKRILILTLLLNIGILVVLKYSQFFASLGVNFVNLFNANLQMPVFKMLLPLGISYYTLQALSYAIDVTSGKYEGETNLIKVTLFVCFFPQLIEGPIGRFDEMKIELIEGRNLESKQVYKGTMILLWGIFKILIVANRFGMLVDDIFKNYMHYHGMMIVVGGVAFIIQLYAEFSGYIDMARGVSEVFHIHLKKNFDKPFISKNVNEFWRRWHISLGNWFRDYIFYPIVASNIALKYQVQETRKAKIMNQIILSFGIFCVWFLTGIWHGAGMKYIVYGLYYGCLMIVYQLLNPIFNRIYDRFKIKETNIILNILQITKTYIFVFIGMMLFRATDLYHFKYMMCGIFTQKGIFDLFSIINKSDFMVAIIGLMIIILLGIMHGFKMNVLEKLLNSAFVTKLLVFIAVFLIIIIFGAYGMGYMPPDPIYGGF